METQWEEFEKRKAEIYRNMGYLIIPDESSSYLYIFVGKVIYEDSWDFHAISTPHLKVRRAVADVAVAQRDSPSLDARRRYGKVEMEDL